jgi:hypothetical protein
MSIVSFSNLKLTNCVFAGNSSLGSSGAIDTYDHSALALSSSILSGNVARDNGGAIYNLNFNAIILFNCTIVANSAPNGNAIACNSSYKSPLRNDVKIGNCILSNGSDEMWNNDDSMITVTYSNIRGGWPGHGNIDADPCFAKLGYWDPNGTPADANDDFWVNGDYHLKSQAGRWDANSASWVKDDVTSPCIDAGDPASPIGLEPFPNGGIINMGAYGGTEEASKSYFGEPPCETIVAGDINGDCIVNFKDFALIAFHWLEEH